MKFSIATVSLGGTLPEKLAAIAAAGFDGVEIFEADVLAHEGTPAEIGRMVRDRGLEIIAFQPFRDFEGMPEPQRSRGFERARRKFELMNELGAGASSSARTSRRSASAASTGRRRTCASSARSRRASASGSASRRWPGGGTSRTTATPGRSSAAPIIRGSG